MQVKCYVSQTPKENIEATSLSKQFQCEMKVFSVAISCTVAWVCSLWKRKLSICKTLLSTSMKTQQYKSESSLEEKPLTQGTVNLTWNSAATLMFQQNIRKKFQEPSRIPQNRSAWEQKHYFTQSPFNGTTFLPNHLNFVLYSLLKILEIFHIIKLMWWQDWCCDRAHEAAT